MHFSLHVLSCGKQCLLRHEHLAFVVSRAPSTCKFPIFSSHTVELEQHVLLARGDANEPHHQSFHRCPWILLSTDQSSHTVRWRCGVREALVWIGSYRFWSYMGTRAQVIVGSLHPVSSMFIDDILLRSPICPLKQATCSNVPEL